MVNFITIFAISFGATVLSAMSGAGSAMFTIPMWLILGYSLPVAQAASKVNGALWTPVAARNYLRAIHVDWKFICGLVVFGLIGAYFGSVAVMGIDAETLKRIIGILIIVLVALVSIHKEFGVVKTAPRTNQFVSSLLAFPLGFYEGFFGSGNGLFTSSMLVKTQGFDLISSLGYYYTISFFWCLFSAILFLSWGYGDMSLIIPSSLGGVAGAYVGSRIGKRQGAGFVKYAFVFLGALLGAKLVLGI